MLLILLLCATAISVDPIRAARNLEEGQRFMEENKDKMISTESGLLYRVVEQGTGAIPQPRQTAQIHYESNSSILTLKSRLTCVTSVC